MTDDFKRRMREIDRQRSRKLAEDLGFQLRPELMTDEELDDHINQNRAARNAAPL